MSEKIANMEFEVVTSIFETSLTSRSSLWSHAIVRKMADLKARMQLREEWERNFEETLAQLQESYRQLLLVNQSSVLDGSDNVIAPPHSFVRLQSSANEVV